MPSDISIFDKGLQFVLLHEGGFVNDPKGGPTNKGITQATYNSFLARLGQAPQDVKTIPDFVVNTIYLYDYWYGSSADQLPSKSAQVHFNFAVNAGAPEAVHVLQSALGIQSTGYFGKLTLAAVNRTLDKTLAKNLIDKQQQFYAGLKDDVNYQGWIDRLKALEQWIGNLD